MSKFDVLQALPMVTIVLGRANDTDTCRVVTACDDFDGIDNSTEFKIPTVKPLYVGTPKWANYVKGVIACFQSAYPQARTVYFDKCIKYKIIRRQCLIGLAVSTFTNTVHITKKKPTRSMVEKKM